MKLFQSLESICSTSTVLATSTIELSIDAIQYVVSRATLLVMNFPKRLTCLSLYYLLDTRQRLKHGERVLGIRFFHPCVLLPPVEVTPGGVTSEASLQRV